MEVTQEFLINNNSALGLRKLSAASFDGKTAYDVKRICYYFDRYVKKLQQEMKAIAEKHAEKNEKGEPVLSGPDSYKLKTDEIPQYQKAMEEVLAKKVDFVKCNKIHFSTIEDAFDLKLSANEIGALEPILDGVEMPKDEEETKK